MELGTEKGDLKLVSSPIKDLEALRLRFFAQVGNRYSAFYMTGEFTGIGMRIGPVKVTVPDGSGRFVGEYNLTGRVTLARHV